MSNSQHRPDVLWYPKPAEEWTEALPVGNGRLGAMVYGGRSTERVQLNEETIWTGGPYDPSREVEPGALDEVRRLVFEEEYFKAHYLFNREMMGIPVEQMKYQPLGNLRLDFENHEEITDYRRELDLDAATATVTYRTNEAGFTREVFSSPVDQAIAVRITADQPGKVAFIAKLIGGEDGEPWGDEKFNTEVDSPDELVLRGRTATFLGIEGRVEYEARAKVLAEGGEVAIEGSKIVVSGADSVTLLILAASNFKSFKDISGDPAERARKYLDGVAGKPYDSIREDHLAEHRRLYRRVSLDLPTTNASDLPSDERLRVYPEGNDPQLAALLFQFGRYLMICSSRPGCIPANLQGIWNEKSTPAWEGKFTTNINLEMNYWPAEVANLSECAEPLISMLEQIVEPGTRVAKKHYNAGGWVLHQNADLWLAGAPMDGPTWGTWTTGGAWLCKHLWEHYLFTLNVDYLSEVYPVLKGAAEFFLDFLIEHPTRGWLVTCPSTSPENFPACKGNHSYVDEILNFRLPGTTITPGPTMDMQILRDLLGCCIEAAGILGVDDDLTRRLSDTKDRLAPMQVGERGNLQEWLEDWDDLEDQHRHISHMYGLFPSDQITPEETSELAEACKVSLNERGDGSTGFSMAWKAACWARLLDGDHAHVCLTNLITDNTCPNFFSQCFNAPQVDGSFGGTAAVAEMLLQSYGDELRLLPALPAEWSDGAVRGLLARSGFEVDISWADGRITSAVVKSNAGKPCNVRAERPLTIICDGQAVSAEQTADNVVSFETETGKSYDLSFGS